ncbi:MAG: hypothetical protein H6625_03190 [Bdellovibrionaceae bacterium]|nr:hypothetical protein [Pseudobdellovibrionaceae bacterium]
MLPPFFDGNKFFGTVVTTRGRPIQLGNDLHPSNKGHVFGASPCGFLLESLYDRSAYRSQYKEIYLIAQKTNPML